MPHYITITPEEQSLSREIESKEEYNLSFFDCMHIAIARTRGYILVTKDEELLERGRKYVQGIKQEEFLY